MAELAATLFAALLIGNPTIAPCEYEDGSEMLYSDSVMCLWDAQDSGNGVGDSFIVVKSTDGDTDTLTYFYEDGRMEQ